VFENRVLRRIYGPMREEVAGGWRQLHNEEIHYMHASPNIVRVAKIKGNEMGRVCSTHGTFQMHATFWLKNLKQ